MEDRLVFVELDRFHIWHEADYLFHGQGTEVIDSTEALEEQVGLCPSFLYDVAANQTPPPQESAVSLEQQIEAIEEQSADDGGEHGGQDQPGSVDVTVAITGDVERVAEQFDRQREQKGAGTEGHGRRGDPSFGNERQTEQRAEREGDRTHGSPEDGGKGERIHGLDLPRHTIEAVDGIRRPARRLRRVERAESGGNRLVSRPPPGLCLRT